MFAKMIIKNEMIIMLMIMVKVMKTMKTLMKIITQIIKSRKIIENENKNNHNSQLIITFLFIIIHAHCFFVFFVILSVSHVYMAHKKIPQIRTKYNENSSKTKENDAYKTMCFWDIALLSSSALNNDRICWEWLRKHKNINFKCF